MNLFIKRINSKKILYFLIVLALNWVQFVRATQYESLIAPAVNASGLLVLFIVFTQISIKKLQGIFTYVYSASCALTIIVLTIYRGYLDAPYYYWKYLFVIMNAWLIGLGIGYVFKEWADGGKIRIKPNLITILWFAFTAVTVIGFSNKWWPLWFFLVFGLYYTIPFDKEDMRRLYDSIIDGTIVSFFIIQSCAFVFRPYDEVRYSGLFVNCNDTALYYLIVYVMILVKLHLLHERREKIGFKLFYFFGAGALLSFLFMTLSRTGWLAAGIITFVYGIIILLLKWKEKAWKVILRGIALFMSFAITFPIVFSCVRYLPTIHPHPVWFQNEYTVNRVHSFDPRDSEKYVEIDELLNNSLGRFGSLWSLVEKKIGISSDSYAAESEIENVYISLDSDIYFSNSIAARFLFMKSFLEQSRWLGRDESKVHILYGDRHALMYHSQNLWVQMTFCFGYIAGVIVLLLSILITVKRFKVAIISDNPYSILALLLTLVFFIYGLTEVVWIPGFIVMPLFFLMQKEID